LFHVGGNVYELVKENKNGWNLEVFRNRYSEVLERYDYVVGDWGYNQLRLRGFFKESNPRIAKDTSIANLEDYINEYCNFGCAYFVLEKVGQSDRPSEEALASEEGGSGERAAAAAAFEGSNRMDRPDRYNRNGEPWPGKPQRPESKPARERPDGERTSFSREERSRAGFPAEREPGRPGGERMQWSDRKPARPDGDRSGRPQRPEHQDRQERGTGRGPERGNRLPERGGGRGSDPAAVRQSRGDKPQQDRPQRHADRPDRGAVEQASQAEHANRGERPDKRPPRRTNPERSPGEQAMAETSSANEHRPGPFRKRRHGGSHGGGHPAAGEPGEMRQRPPKNHSQGPGNPPPAGN